MAFQQAAHKVLLDDDNLLPLLHLTVDYQGKDNKGLLLCAYSKDVVFREICASRILFSPDMVLFLLLFGDMRHPVVSL